MQQLMELIKEGFTLSFTSGLKGPEVGVVLRSKGRTYHTRSSLGSNLMADVENATDALRAEAQRAENN